ncbi:5-formyltetrahydrofolate cyclo-ligase [Microvirga tunisiensis]|uniref:5-formyltetrahydrofolate cyclo-ligase n=1 Tax=Pannonibacter tanglangensis TaxID=2750084 RepID=A0ABW9ZRA0_9HYPH|nr:5-formyltetrahydrofolate cyclo-ligase [Pannonibacter sp. XCT-34]
MDTSRPGGHCSGGRCCSGGHGIVRPRVRASGIAGDPVSDIPNPDLGTYAGAEADADIGARKAAVRKQALARRAALPLPERIEASLMLAEAAGLLGLPGGVTVAGFWPIRDEIDPRPLLFRLGELGHPLCLPVVVGPRLVFRRLTRETQLVRAGFGTVVPDERAPELTPDVLLMPLSAYDDRGWRLGYGRGYYDTAIADLMAVGHPVRRIGLAFSVQQVDHVPTEPHDQPLEAILTEQGLTWFNKREGA